MAATCSYAARQRAATAEYRAFRTAMIGWFVERSAHIPIAAAETTLVQEQLRTVEDRFAQVARAYTPGHQFDAGIQTDLARWTSEMQATAGSLLGGSPMRPMSDAQLQAVEDAFRAEVEKRYSINGAEELCMALGAPVRCIWEYCLTLPLPPTGYPPELQALWEKARGASSHWRSELNQDIDAKLDAAIVAAESGPQVCRLTSLAEVVDAVALWHELVQW